MIEMGPEDSIDSAIKRFRKQCDAHGIIAAMKRHETYLKPSERRRQKSFKAQRQRRRGAPSNPRTNNAEE
jgi:small subunit ribosomal protein S21